MIKNYTVFILLFCCPLIHTWAQASLFLSPINSDTDLIEEPNSIARDELCRYWVKTNDHLWMFSGQQIQDLSHVPDWKMDDSSYKLFAGRNHNMYFIPYAAYYYELDLQTNVMAKKSLPGPTKNIITKDGKTSLFASGQNEPMISLDIKTTTRQTRAISSNDALCTGLGVLPTNGKWIEEADASYYYLNQRLFILREDVNTVIAHHKVKGVPALSMRVAIPLGVDRVFLSADSSMAIYVQDKDQLINVAELPQNQAIVEKYDNSIIFHATPVGDEHLVLIDQLGQILLYHTKTHSLTDDFIDKPDKAFLKNIYTDRAGNVWIGTYDKEIFQFYPDGKLKRIYSSRDNARINDIFRFYEDQKGYMWVGMSESFVIIDPANEKVYDPAPQINALTTRLLKEGISSFAYHQALDRMWIGTYGGGLFYIKYDAFMDCLLGECQNQSIDNLFISLNEKVRINQKDIKYLNAESNKLYARTDQGMMIIDSTENIRTISIQDGFANALNNNYNYITDDHVYWCGDQGGYIKIYLDKLEDIKPVCGPTLHEINLSDYTQALPYPLNVGGRMRINDELRFVTFTVQNRFSEPDPYISRNLEFKVNDDKFTPVKHQEMIFSSSQTGLHVVSLVNKQASVFEKPIPLEFSVLIVTAWWKTWWFRSIFSLLIFGIVYLFIRTIQRQKKYVQHIRSLENASLRSQMNPHFISNSLNSINYYILENRTEEASSYIVKFSKLIRRILQNTAQEFIPLKEEIESLEMYISMEKLRFKDKFSYDIDIAPGVDLSQMVPSMILQPVVENAIWHGLVQKEGNGHLVIQVNHGTGGLQIVIEDDGIGRKEAQRINSKKASKRKSFGLEIVTKRLRLLNDQHHKKYEMIIRDRSIGREYPGTKVTINL
ncbi:MAG: histidine kinase [Saprospiraceae bacterium]|nr:histidine kinase [Saprospiraceae bacterium]